MNTDVGGHVGDGGKQGRGLRAAILASLLLGLSGCRGGHADALPPGSLVVSLSADIRGTSPGVNRDANTDVVLQHVFEGLVGYREDGSPAPLLAERIATSPDGRVYRFELRRGVRFHNGAPLTSAEVVWSWRRYLDPRTGWLCLSDFDGSHGARIESVSADGPMAVLFHLSRPEPLFLAEMASVQCGGGAILHPSSVNPDGSWRWPVATGPYRFARWKRGQYIDLQAFPGYARQPGKADGLVGEKIAYAPVIRWMIIRDEASRLAALVKGQIDVMPEVTSATVHKIADYPQIRLETRPSAIVNPILIEPSDPLLADVHIRRALALAIDRSTLVTLGTADTAAANASLVPTSSAYFDGTLASGQASNEAEARALLHEAGYHGQPITLTTNRRYADMFDQALLVQAMARRVGLNIRLKVTEWASQLDAYQAGRFQLMSFSYSTRADPLLIYDTIIGDRKRSPRKQWDDPRAIALLAAARSEPDPARRRSMIDALHRLMLADTPIVVLFNPGDNNAVRREVRGFRAWSLARARLWGVRK